MSDRTSGTATILACPEHQAGKVARILRSEFTLEDPAAGLDGSALVLGYVYTEPEVRCGTVYEFSRELSALEGVVAIVTEDPNYEYIGDIAFIAEGKVETYAMDGKGARYVESDRITRLLAETQAESAEAGEDWYRKDELIVELFAELSILAGDTPLVHQVNELDASLRDAASVERRLPGGRTLKEVDTSKLPRVRIPSPEEEAAFEAETQQAGATQPVGGLKWRRATYLVAGDDLDDWRSQIGDGRADIVHDEEAQ